MMAVPNRVDLFAVTLPAGRTSYEVMIPTDAAVIDVIAVLRSLPDRATVIGGARTGGVVTLVLTA